VKPKSPRKKAPQVDVVVIGAGFGGPVAARACAAAGLKTLVLERAANVGDKVISGLTIPFYGFLFGPAFIRDGNPPIERPVDGVINYIIRDIDTGDMEIDDSLKIPKPLSPVFSFGYNAYCKPFCEWEARKAAACGAEIRTSTTVVDFIRENGRIRGVITDRGERIRAGIVIDAEGSQGILAVKAGVREKYPPEAISLADTYDYEMDKDKVDRILGNSIRFCWAWDEQRIAPPLGYGNGLMVWPYRKSVHFIQDQCLHTDRGSVPHLRKLFEEYHANITTKLPWWREDVAPHATPRARMWEGFEIYVGLDERLREMPNHTDGMILVGDVAGLENTELCDGVPTAWFSAEIAAEVAIEALRAGDTSKAFLKRYDDRIRAHPIIQWAIRGRNRYDLRHAQKGHDLDLLRKCVHDGWGLGGFTHMSTPLAACILRSLEKDPLILAKWIRMYLRYYYNWHHERFDGLGSGGNGGDHEGVPAGAGDTPAHRVFRLALKGLESALELSAPVTRRLAGTLAPAAAAANPLMKLLMPGLEAANRVSRRLEPVMSPLSDRLVSFVCRADPKLFDS